MVLGTGGVANNRATAFAAIDGVTVMAWIDTRPEQLRAFWEKHDIAQGFVSVDAAIAWGRFDAVTNVTPDAAH